MRDVQAVIDGLNALQSDIKTTGGDYYGADLAGEQKDVSQTQTDMQTVLNETGSGDSGQLCSDAGAVQSDVGGVQSDVGTIQSDQASSDSDINSVSNDISQLRTADTALQSDRQNDPADVPPNAPSATDVSNAIHAAQSAIAKARQAGTIALGRANQMEATAASYQGRSDAACKAAGG